MRWLKVLLVSVALTGVAPRAEAGTGKIIKTLPHHLDQKGLHTLSPSLYERDAYQQQLRNYPELCSGLRFDIQWKTRSVDKEKLKLRVEIRSSKTVSTKPFVVEQAAQTKGWFTYWSGVTIDGDTFRNLGQIIAWRVTLWEGDQELAEQKSFLW